MDKSVIKMIDQRLLECENIYNIKVICWTMRGSIGINIHRENSDLDLAFLFYSLDGKCHAIHDILGYGYDFWGWDIRDAISSVKQNNELYYNNPFIKFIPQYLTNEHKRGGLNYFYSFFNILGNKNCEGTHFFINECLYKLKNAFEKKVIIEYITITIPGIISQIKLGNKISGNDYLYTIWRILLSYHILDGGLPGEEEIVPLLNKYVNPSVKDRINKLRQLYRTVSAKDSIKIKDEVLNKFIEDGYRKIEECLIKEEPKHQDDSTKILNELITKLDNTYGGVI